jgi:hypothetical protein
MAGQTSTTKQHIRASLACPWLKRLGLVGFAFFLIKGLLWLVLPVLLVWLGWQE